MVQLSVVKSPATVWCLVNELLFVPALFSSNDEDRYWVCEGAEVSRESKELVAGTKEKQPEE